ncbi:glutamate synthase [NADH] [Tilletia horrida]|uniref:Glutamate synthase [NADH] n=1 Tax=Tilletia horrida TaxID=155126 RepID=A0AAN6GI33_9BASI|nr:glutamate synthase [NADH] [Tilletia horrida]KAK0558529.1 glutamate synthase [NADH] [Tilletia horrida]
MASFTLASDTKILVHGRQPLAIGALQVGDRVLNAQGLPVTVNSISHQLHNSWVQAKYNGDNGGHKRTVKLDLAHGMQLRFKPSSVPVRVNQRGNGVEVTRHCEPIPRIPPHERIQLAQELDVTLNDIDGALELISRLDRGGSCGTVSCKPIASQLYGHTVIDLLGGPHRDHLLPGIVADFYDQHISQLASPNCVEAHKKYSKNLAGYADRYLGLLIGEQTVQPIEELIAGLGEMDALVRRLAWVLGYWFGDGMDNCGDLSCGEAHLPALIEYLEQLAASSPLLRPDQGPWEVKVRTRISDPAISLLSAADVTISAVCHSWPCGRINLIAAVLRHIDMLNNKLNGIPGGIFSAPWTIRAQFFAGMLDSDGWRRKGAWEFSQHGEGRQKMVEDFGRLAQSLGFRVNPIVSFFQAPPFQQSRFRKDGQTLHPGWKINVVTIGGEALSPLILYEYKRAVEHGDPFALGRRKVNGWVKKTGAQSMTTIEVNSNTIVTEHRLILHVP